MIILLFALYTRTAAAIMIIVTQKIGNDNYHSCIGRGLQEKVVEATKQKEEERKKPKPEE
jgi:hypothetical protein